MSIVKNFNNLDTDNTLGGNNASDTVIPSQKAVQEYVDNNSGVKRNIGEIIQSTIPLNDAGLHLLDGALIQGDGIYADFVNYIADLYTDNPNANYFTTESAWQSSVTTYGVCGKFVYTETQTDTKLYYSWNSYFTTSETPQVGDSVYTIFHGNISVSGTITNVNNDFIILNGGEFTDIAYRTPSQDIFATVKTVRLPKITGIIEGTTDLSALGNLVQAGLPNITGVVGNTTWNGNGKASGEATSALFWNSNNPGSYGAATQSAPGGYVELDASRSNPIYGHSSTVQPQTVRVLYYIVVATSIKTNIQVDIDEIATDLNGKAGTDLANVTNAGKVLMSGMGMPSNRYIDLTLNASGSTYTAPANGWFYIDKQATGAQYLAIGNTGINGNIWLYAFQIANTISGQHVELCLPIQKGFKATINYNLGGTTVAFRFIYAQGSESEAN